MTDLRFAPLTGRGLAAALEDVARLRIAVFRDWPYLYDGDMDYERGYLAAYANSPGALVVGCFDGERLVGAATGAPLEDHADAFGEGLARTGIDPATVFYCGESVLLPAYRRQGAGHRFFDLREAHGRTLGRRAAAFCAVVRPADHPGRPAGYRPLDAFWRKRGYAPLPGVTATYSWRDVGADRETEKSLQVWYRIL